MQFESIEEEGAAMTTMTEQRSELARRSTDGIEVSLFWNGPTDRVTIELVDRRFEEHLEFEVAPDKALDAFRHPYAYAHAPAQALDDLVMTREAVHS
jgi:hypothetical protein